MLNTIQSLAADYQRDGVVHLPAVLDQRTQQLIAQAYDWSMAHPTPSGCMMYPDTDGAFYQDLCNPAAATAYHELLVDTLIPDIAASLWGTPEVWFLYEQVWRKDAGAGRRTPWHQDSPYLALDGQQVAVLWINLEPVAQANSLEFVRGSWRGTLYDGSSFDGPDDTAPVFGKGLPRLPDIEKDRASWDIVSWAVAPGDVVVFHPSTLHGGGSTMQSQRRRTLSLRLFGRDAVFAARPGLAPAPLVAGLADALRPGEPFRHPAFPRLRPTPAGFDTIPVAVDDGHHINVSTRLRSA